MTNSIPPEAARLLALPNNRLPFLPPPPFISSDLFVGIINTDLEKKVKPWPSPE